MNVLALDTTTRVGSVALVENDRVIEERDGDGSRSHAERLPHELVAVATANGVPLQAIDLFAVAAGPGSFTGLRIGIATIQGLALVARRRIVGVAALDAIAHAASRELETGALVAAWMDAHRREVFAALYRVSAAPPFDPTRLEELDPASVGDPDSVLARWQGMVTGGTTVFAGDGAMLYAGRIRSRHPDAAVVEPGPLAGAIGRLAVSHSRNGAAIDPAAIRPVYVRRPDAEVARDKRTT